MPGIRRKKETVSIEEEDDLEEGRTILLCPHCIEYGFKEPLRHKLLKGNEPKPRDYESWCQCYACGKVYPRHEVKVEGI